MPTVPYTSLLAANLRAARAAADISQGDIAARMRELGFHEWRRQTVGSTERGKRRLTVEEALGLMVALETDLTALVYPPAEFQAVSLPGGHEVVLPAAKYRYNPERESIWDGNVCKLPRNPSGKQAEDGAA